MLRFGVLGVLWKTENTNKRNWTQNIIGDSPVGLRRIRILDQGDDAANYLAQIVGGYIGGHSDSNAG